MKPYKRNTFTKSERLCSKKVIEKLFDNGETLFAHPVKFVFTESEKSEVIYPAQVMFVVPKKLFRKAVDRNRLKRQMRESYRLCKNQFYEKCQQNNKNYALAIIYVAKDFSQFSLTRKKIELLLNQMVA